MAISLLSNLPAFSIRRELNVTERDAQRAMERMASGKRINHVHDDPAGLALAASLKSKLHSIQQAQRNAMDATSLIQVAEGGLNTMDNILSRLRELAMQAASDTVGDTERQLLHLEFNQLRDEVARISATTRYLGTPLLNGTQKELMFQIGTENSENDRIIYNTSTVDVRPSSLGIDDISIEDRDSAVDSLAAIDNALSQVQAPRAQLGAIQSRMQSVSEFLGVYEENLTAARGRIFDTDYAKETTEQFQAQVRQGAAIAVLAQANQQPAHVLKLLERSM